MDAPVVVQGLPVAEELRGAALSACSEALKYCACVGAEERVPGAARPSAVATITTIEGSERRVRIVLEHGFGESRVATRETRFAAEDPPVERWRATGLLIAALVGESEVLEDKVPDNGDGRIVQEVRAIAPSAGWLGLSAIAGPGLDDGSARIGGSLQGAVALRGASVFFTASAGHAWRPVDDARLDVTWTTATAGGGLRTWFARADVEVRLRLELLAEYISASSTSAALRGGGHRLIPGLRGGADALWPASAPLGLTAGISMWSLSGGTAFTLDGQKVASSPWFSYAGWIGGQWSFR
jgi:hypothetical protein